MSKSVPHQWFSSPPAPFYRVVLAVVGWIVGQRVGCAPLLMAVFEKLAGDISCWCLKIDAIAALPDHIHSLWTLRK